jgi:chemotaxis protein methyltransferase CheR
MQPDNQSNEYQSFRNFLEDVCGILLGDNKAYLVNSRLKPVLARHSLTSVSELVSLLTQASNKSLREEVVDAMTTNETLWFRDAHPFNILTSKLFPMYSEKAGRAPIKIWSAACSSGQEPYSIAITAKEFKDANPTKSFGGVKLVATDISSTVLSMAQAGIYEMLALGRGMSETRRKKCFTPHDDGRWEIKPEFKSVIDFQSLNLMETYQKIGSNLDIIFCRNVLIYFSADLKKEILTKMHRCLKPGGYLILGASESLNGLSDYYQMEQCYPGIIYKAK